MPGPAQNNSKACHTMSSKTACRLEPGLPVIRVCFMSHIFSVFLCLTSAFSTGFTWECFLMNDFHVHLHLWVLRETQSRVEEKESKWRVWEKMHTKEKGRKNFWEKIKNCHFLEGNCLEFKMYCEKKLKIRCSWHISMSPTQRRNFRVFMSENRN